MSHWDDAMADLSSFGCSPGVLSGTSPLDMSNILEMFGGALIKPDGDGSYNGDGQQKVGSQRGGKKNRSSGGGRHSSVPPRTGSEERAVEEDTTSDEIKGHVEGAVMDMDDELAEMANTLLLLHEGG